VSSSGKNIQKSVLLSVIYGSIKRLNRDLKSHRQISGYWKRSNSKPINLVPHPNLTQEQFMKKTITLVSALIFTLALMMPGLILADDGKHMEEGSAKKMDQSSHEEYKDKDHSKEYKDGKDHMKEGSAGKEEYDKSSDHKKMEEGSKDGKEMAAPAPKNEGS